MICKILPELLIFQLGSTLWPNHPDFVKYPLTVKNGAIIAKDGKVIKCYPDVPAIFEKLKHTNMKIALLECVSEVNNTIRLINAFGWQNYSSFVELGRESEMHHIKKLHERFKIPYNKMLFFYNRDIYYGTDSLRKKGVFIKHIYGNEGLTMDALNDALREYEQLKNS